MRKVLLSTTYFGPVQWYQKLYRSDVVYLEQCESFQKQSYRNRCVIATTNGLQTLSVPITHNREATPSLSGRVGEGLSLPLLSSHGKWRAEHWNALQSAYGDSPFFDYYVDDLKPFFTERHWDRLFDFNLAIIRKMCELLDIQPDIRLTETFLPPQEGCNSLQNDASSPLADSDSFRDYRYAIHPKHPLPDADFQPRRYYQVYSQKYGFQPNLSILDLLFNMGNEAILYL